LKDLIRPVIVAYDISDNKARKNVFKILKMWRLDGQKSVHECRLKKNQAQELFIQISEHINQSTDSIMIAWIETHRKILYRGLGRDSLSKNLWEWEN